ncbi:MAG: hypothetical protein QM756_14335 [Polyangiaceae bacterium]
MRELVTGLILVSASSLRVCSSEDSRANAASSASAEVAASGSAGAALKGSAQVDAKARVGGQLLTIGDYSVDLLMHQAGLVEAVVFDAAGHALSQGVALSLVASTKAQGKANVALAFSEPRGRFVGSAGAGVELRSGPLDLALTLAGKPLTAHIDAALVAKGAEFGGTVLLVGEHSVEVLARANGEILAFVRNAAGALVTSAAGLEVKAAVQAGAGVERVALDFDAARKAFVGRVKAGVELAPGPLELSIASKGAVATGQLGRLALRAEAQHGGQVVVAGDFSVELVAQGKAVQAFVYDAAAKAVAAADAALVLDVGGSKVSLAWDAPSASYRGELGAGINLDASPISVSLDAGGKAFVGAAASLRGIASARLDPPSVGVDAKLDGKALGDAKLPDAKLGAKLDAAANVKVPNVKAKLSAEADKAAKAAAQVKVTPPSIKVEKSASASAGTGAKTGAKASAGFSFGVK